MVDIWNKSKVVKVVDDSDDLSISKDQLIEASSKRVRGHITDELVARINSIIEEPDMRAEYRENIIGYLDVLKDGRVNMLDYVNAVKYVSYKMRGDTNKAAYAKVFPDRIARYKANGTVDYSPWVSSYRKSRLVVGILERSIIPTHLLNADIYQESINVLADLMVNSDSDKVRQESAKSLMDGLRPPEVNKFSVDVVVKQDDALIALRESTDRLINAQRVEIEKGRATADGIANSELIVEGSYEVDES